MTGSPRRRAGRVAHGTRARGHPPGRPAADGERPSARRTDFSVADGVRLTPPVPVKVLDGDVHGNAKAVKHLVPLATVP